MTADKPHPATTGRTLLRSTHRATARRFVVTNKRKHKLTKHMIIPTAWCHSQLTAKKSFSSLLPFADRTVRGSIPDGARVSFLFQTGPGTHPASYTKGSGSFPLVKRPGRGVFHPTRLALRSKKVSSYNSWFFELAF